MSVPTLLSSWDRLHTYLKKINGHLLCRLIFRFHCSAEGIMEITGRSSKRSLYRQFSLVTENKNWVDAQVYCEDKYRASLVIIDNDSDKVLLEYYLKPLLGQLACRLIFVSIDIINVKKLDSLKHSVRSQITCLKQQKSFCDLDHAVSL